MTGEPEITIVGNLTADPDLRFTQNGTAVANVTIASTPRNFDKEKNQHVDGETLFMRGSVWREIAENAAVSLTKGSRVIAQGRMVSRSFETREGEKRTTTELQIEEIGPSLKWVTAQPQSTRDNAQGSQQSGWGGGQSSGWGGQQGGQNDPWGSASPGWGAQ